MKGYSLYLKPWQIVPTLSAKNPTVFQVLSAHSHITDLIFIEGYFMVSTMC